MTILDDKDPPAVSRFWSPRRLLLLAPNIILYTFMIRWVFHNIDFARLVASVSRIPLWAILLSSLLNFTALLLYGVRMQLFLFRNFAVSFAAINIGYAYNTILPFRVGDAMKVYLCRRLFGLRISETVAATVAEKLVDLCKLLVIGTIVMVFSASNFIQAGTLLPLAAVIALGLAGLVLARLLLVRIVRLLPKRGALRRGVVGLFRHSSRYKFGRIFLMTGAIWAVNILLFYVVFNTYLPGVKVDVLGAMAMLVITALTIALPSAPAGIGLF